MNRRHLLAASLGLTAVSRLSAASTPKTHRYRIGVSLPGQDNVIPAFEATSGGLSVPLLTPRR